MGGIQHPHWHAAPARLASLRRSSPMSLPPASMSPLARLLISLLCMREARGGSRHNTKRGGEEILNNLLFGISVIESHSYIKVRKLCVAGDISARWWWLGEGEGGIREHTDVSLSLFFPFFFEQCLPSLCPHPPPHPPHAPPTPPFL